MRRPLFTPEELEELRRFDAEVDEAELMPADYYQSDKLEREVEYDRLDLEQQAARAHSRELNRMRRNSGPKKPKSEEKREHDRAVGKAYREANKEREKIRKAAWYQAHKSEINARRNARKRAKNAEKKRMKLSGEEV